MVSTIDTLNYLEGAWALDRRIIDHRDHRESRFLGHATFEWDDTCASRDPLLRLSENGEFRRGRHRLTSTRSLYFLRDRGPRALAYFSDGRLFIDLDLSARRWCATHVCGPDSYEIELAVLSPGCFQERWRVRGPSKEYDALTIAQRREY